MRRPKLEINSTATPWTLHSDEGYTESDHGFIEQGNIMSMYPEYIQTNEFIEY